MTADEFLNFSDPLPEPMLLLSYDGSILAGNRATGDRLEIPVDRLKHRRLHEVVAESPEEVTHYLRTCSRSRSVVFGSLSFLNPNAQAIPCRAEGAVVVPASGNSPALLFIRLIPKESSVGKFVALNQRIAELGKEIHRRTQAEQALKEAHEMLANRAAQLEQLVAKRTAKLKDTISDLEAFSYTIAHDMRAPLRAMQNYSKILMEEHVGGLNGEAREFLERIALSADRLDRFIHDILNFSKIVRGDLELEPIDTRALLDEIVHSYPNLHPSCADITVSKDLPNVLGNRAGLTQAFSNLLGNAVKFVKTGTKPAILVGFDSTGDWAKRQRVRLWFEDNGIGISKGSEKRIFQMFQRLNPSDEFEGNGMGLAIVRKVTERMGGEVGVESDFGKGSRFWIELQKPGSKPQ